MDNREYFRYNGSNSKISNCVHKANEIMNSDEFYRKIKQKEGRYKLATCTGPEIAEYVKNAPVMSVNLYASKNPWSSALGYFIKSKPYDIFLNSRRLNRSNASIVATLCHEIVHASDSLLEANFGHADNKYASWKEETAPYYIDNIAEVMAGGKGISIQENRKFKVFKWWNPLTWFK